MWFQISPFTVPQQLLANRYYQIYKFQKLEKFFNYSFKDSTYLIQAFTHPSHGISKIIGTYENLEYLGDAVINFFVTFHLFKKLRKNMKQLQEVRQQFLSNERLSFLSQKYGFLNYIIISSNISILPSSKIAADIFESLFCAIFLDSGMDFNVTGKIFYELTKNLDDFRAFHCFPPKK